MRLLLEIGERDLGISDSEILKQTYEFRKSARAVLLNDKGEVSIQHVSKYDYYKLPGGGVEIGETMEETLKREIIEEVGCDLKIENELGIIIEYRNIGNLLHISYGYLCRVMGDVKGPSYEQGEIEDGYVPLWMNIDESIRLTIEKQPRIPYPARFMATRDNRFLQEANMIINSK